MECLINEICQRADNYKFLSDCYYLPDEGLMNKVADIARTDSYFAELSSLVPPLTELEELKIDFAALFVGPYKLLAPPYGSVYLEDGKLIGDSTVDVSNCYQREKLDIVTMDAPDHIAIELEFMYCLVTRQIEATRDENLQELQSCQSKQASFLQLHLGRWISVFADNVKNNAKTEFYRNLAQLTEMFVQKDKTNLLQAGT